MFDSYFLGVTHVGACRLKEGIPSNITLGKLYHMDITHETDGILLQKKLTPISC